MFHLVIAWVAHQDTAAHIKGLQRGLLLDFLFIPYATRPAKELELAGRKFVEF